MRSLLFVLLFIPISLYSQFEGRIKFDMSYEWKADDGLTTEQFAQFMGSKMEYFYKGSYYKSKTNGMMYKEQIYSPFENRLYNVVNDSDTLIWINGAINSDTVVSYSIQETDEVILGYECQVFIVETTKGTGKYYFSKELKVDPENFKDHHYGNFALVSSQTQSVSLRVEIDNDTLSIIYEAVEITEMNLDDSFFRIPDLPSKETPYY